ncbi:MAG: hypothetical protein QXD98_01790 [Candidatus Diapherotrites archaeon]
MATRRVHALNQERQKKNRLKSKIPGFGKVVYNIRVDKNGLPAELFVYEKGKMTRLTIQRIGKINFVIYKKTILIFTTKGIRRATPKEQKLFEIIIKNLNERNIQINF